jgi:hypothetical protein
MRQRLSFDPDLLPAAHASHQSQFILWPEQLHGKIDLKKKGFQSMKKITATLLILATMVSLSFLLFAPAYGQEGIATTTPTQRMEYLPTLTTQTAPVSSVSRDALQKYASEKIETQTINGIEMSASNFRVNGSLFEVNICFTAPDNREWMIGEGFIQTENNRILLLGSKNLEISRNLEDGIGEITIISDGNINVEKINYSVPNYRCDTLQFVVDTGGKQYPEAVSLTINNIHTFPQGCMTTETIQSILDEKHLGIRVSCTETDSNGLSSVKIEILEKPQGMSEEQAQQYIAEAQRQATFINGPWVFEGTVTGAGNP